MLLSLSPNPLASRVRADVVAPWQFSARFKVLAGANRELLALALTDGED